jgi:hypothetical protein
MSLQKQSARFGAHLIRATIVVDKAYAAFDRLRSRVVPRLAPSTVLDAYNNLAYGATAAYRADSVTFRRGLFRWEEQAIARFFPPVPARILVGGAGGGREAFALAERGYGVAAFEPAEQLANSLAAGIREGMRLTVFRGRYEDLPALEPLADSGRGTDAARATPGLQAGGAFDAGILGWSSFSHIRGEERRSRALRQFGELVTGPILVSAFPATGAAPGTKRRRPAFAIHVGVYQPMSGDELEAAVRAAGFEVLHLDATEGDGNWLHAVIRRV